MVDTDEGRSYYPVMVGLKFRRLKPETWSAEDRVKFWEKLFEAVEETGPKEKFPETTEHPDIGHWWEETQEPPPAPAHEPDTPLPVPEVVPVTEKKALVKAGKHVLKHITGGDDTDLGPLFEPLKKQSVIDEIVAYQGKDGNPKVAFVGIEPTWRGLRAIQATWKLLTEKRYAPEPAMMTGVREEVTPLGEKKLSRRIVESPAHKQSEDLRKAFSYGHELPVWEGEPAEWLRAYGLVPRDLGRGWLEFHPGDREEALTTLMESGTRPFVWSYHRLQRDASGEPVTKPGKNGKKEPVKELVEAFAPYQLVTFIRDEVTNELKRIRIIPAPVTVDEIHSYFVLYPASLDEDILTAMGRKGKGRPPIYQKLFMLWLHLRVAEDPKGFGKGEPRRHHYQNLARRLRMDAYLKSRNTKRVREELLPKCFEVARALGYLADVKTEGDYYVLTVDPSKFYSPGALPDPSKALPGGAPL